ncbi:MAG: asparagine synthase (glutamine-hydrolyzing) [bacterium]
MCGITGIIDKTRKSIDIKCLKNSINKIQNRGPDDQGYWIEKNIGFGHCRLSIIDTSPAGHQPMISSCGRYVITYNGEIYNYQDIRRILGLSENSWQSHSDTETIIEAYKKWGVECLNIFHGMFAFAIWDRKQNKLFAARDRMGVKPFYYHNSSKCFAFSSRPSALLQLDEKINHTLNGQALRYYLEAGYIPAPFSIYREINKLEPAHYLLIDSEGQIIKKQYWTFLNILVDVSLDSADEKVLLEELDGILSRTIRLRMVSDVPIGAFLSGGIDSSLVVALMRKFSTGPIKTFTIGFDEKNNDESIYAKAVADYLGTEHYCEMMRVNDLLNLVDDFFKYYDEPFFDHSAFPVMAVSRLACRYVKVSLSGDGGDEIFGGYHYYNLIQKLSFFYKLPNHLRFFLSSFFSILPKHELKLLAAALKQKNPSEMFAFSRSIAKDFKGVLEQDIVKTTNSIRNLFDSASQKINTISSIAEKSMRLDASFILPEDYLQKVDIGSMTYSLESRDPLLDQELVEWAAKLPLKWKIRKNINKYLLRKLAYRYIPKEILDRPKRGFGTPMDVWLRGELKEWALERCHCKKLFHNTPLDQKKVIDLMALHLKGTRNTHPLLWAILVFLEFNNRNFNQ